MNTERTVYLVDDHTVVLNALSDMLSSAGLRVLGTATDEGACLQGVAEHHPNILVADLNLESSGNGLEMIRTVCAEHPETRIIVFSMRDQIHSVAAAFKAGASAFIYKSQDPFLIADAAKMVMEGKIFFLPGQAEALASYYARGDTVANAINDLSQRDKDIFKMLARGIDSKEAGSTLGINEKTIHNRATEIGKRLECDRKDFTRLALLYGVITDSDLLQGH